MPPRGKIVLLLGAGASAPFIRTDDVVLSTEFLTHALFEHEMWQSVKAQLDSLKSKRDYEFLDKLDLQDLLFVLQRIRILLSSDSGRPLTFEQVIHLWDIVCNYNVDPTGKETISDILLGFWNDGGPSLHGYAFRNSDQDGWMHAPYMAREVIASAILSLWDNPSAGLQVGIRSTRSFFGRLSRDFGSVCAYSLNYDPLIYTSLSDNSVLSLGFDPYNFFDPDAFLKQTNVLAFPHGHIGFVPSGRSTVFCSNFGEAQRQRIEGILDTTADSTRYFDLSRKGVHFNTWLITGLDKVDAFGVNPFAAYFHRFAIDVAEAECIILIGTSLLDVHLNSMIANAITLGARLLFVTLMQPREIQDAFRHPSTPPNILLRLWELSNDRLTLKDKSGGDRFEGHIDRVCANLEEKGYARLTNNVAIYTSGAEAFFEQDDVTEVLECREPA